MIANDKWKYIHAAGFPPVLFDRENDPDEFTDLGRSPEHADQCAVMHRALADWSLQYRQRVTVSEERATEMIGLEDKLGVLIGYWDEDDIVAPAKAPSFSGTGETT
jgi:arylsulfatase A-like enzyme